MTEPTDTPVDADEWHGLTLTALLTPDGEVVDIAHCPELAPEQLLLLIRRAISSLRDAAVDLRAELAERN